MKYQFRTNVKCSGCVAQLSPFLDKQEGIQEWHVDTANPGKTLTVESSVLDEKAIREIVKQAGYDAELIDDKNRKAGV